MSGILKNPNRPHDAISSLMRETSNVPPPSEALKARILRQVQAEKSPAPAPLAALRFRAPAPNFWTRGALLAASFLLGVALQAAGAMPFAEEPDNLPFLLFDEAERSPVGFIADALNPSDPLEL